MAHLGHVVTSDVPAATKNKDLGRGEYLSAKWVMLKNMDLRRRKFVAGANVPENVPTGRGALAKRRRLEMPVQCVQRCPRGM
jgi:hypothetical protein